MRPQVRSFKLLNDKFECIYHGRFTGSTPKHAAVQAAAHLFKKEQLDQRINNEISVCIIESTRGSARTKYFYKAKMVKLVKPVQIHIGDKMTEYNYKLALKRFYNDAPKDNNEFMPN
jgi:hypothetical protein